MVSDDVASGARLKFYDEYNFFVSSGKEKLDVREGFSAPWVVFWVALIVRLACVMLAHTYRVRPYGDHFGFGWEMGRIARALATGYGYADPFSGHTGPTTWVTPAYPLMIAGAFKLFGMFSPLGCMGADRDQLRFECTDGADDVGDRGALLQYERGEMVRMDMRRCIRQRRQADWPMPVIVPNSSCTTTSEYRQVI